MPKFNKKPNWRPKYVLWELKNSDTFYAVYKFNKKNRMYEFFHGNQNIKKYLKNHYHKYFAALKHQKDLNDIFNFKFTYNERLDNMQLLPIYYSSKYEEFIKHIILLMI